MSEVDFKFKSMTRNTVDGRGAQAIDPAIPSQPRERITKSDEKISKDTYWYNIVQTL